MPTLVKNVLQDGSVNFQATLNVTVPSGALPGDLLIVRMVGDTAAFMTPQGTLVQLDQVADGIIGRMMGIFYVQLPDPVPGSYQLTAGSATSYHISAEVYRGVDFVNGPFGANSGIVGDSLYPFPTPSITPAEGEIILATWVDDAILPPQQGALTPSGGTVLQYISESAGRIKSFVAYNYVAPAAVPTVITLNSTVTEGGRTLIHAVALKGGTQTLSRISSGISEDARSIASATEVIPVDSSIGVMAKPGTTIDPATPLIFHEALEQPSAALQFRPIQVPASDGNVHVTGETLLSRLARTPAPAIVDRIEDIAAIPGTTATATRVVQYIVDQFSVADPALVFAPVPDLRYLVQGNDYSGSNGEITVSAIYLPQDSARPRSMMEVLREVLELFTGYVIRQTSQGVIEIVPRPGTPSDTSTIKTLAKRDAYSLKQGVFDPRRTVNRATVEVTAGAFIANQSLAGDMYVSKEGFDPVTAGITLPTSTHQPEGEAEGFSSGILVGSNIITVDLRFRAWRAGNTANPPTSNVLEYDQTQATVQLFRDAGPTVLKVVKIEFGQTVVWTEVSLTYTKEGVTAWISDYNATRFVSPVFFPMVHIVEITSITGAAWGAGPSITATFGTQGDNMPGLTESQQAYGVIEKTIRSSVFPLTATQAQDIARAYVLANLDGRLTHEIEQSPVAPYPIKFDDVGRQVDLWTAERGVIVGRSYADRFGYEGGEITSIIKVEVFQGLVDPNADYLLDTNGEYILDTDGNFIQTT